MIDSSLNKKSKFALYVFQMHILLMEMNEKYEKMNQKPYN